MLSTKMFNAVRSMQKLNSVSAHLYSTKQYQVFHDHKLKEFTLGQEKGEKAVLQYKELEPSVILLEHIIVPAEFQGQGIGKLLAEAALEFALDKNLKIKISCDFVKKYLEKNPKPEFQKIVLDN